MKNKFKIVTVLGIMILATVAFSASDGDGGKPSVPGRRNGRIARNDRISVRNRLIPRNKTEAPQ